MRKNKEQKNEAAFDAIFSQAKNLKFLPEEKSLTKSRLVLFIRDRPVRDSGFLSQIMQSWSEAVKLNLSIKSMIAALLIVVLLTGSASALAEGSLPGAPLYPVKVGVNENIRTFFSFSDDAKADWSVQLAERRLGEAEKLVSRGNFSAKTHAELEAKFAEALKRFESNVKNVEASSNSKAALELSSDFEASLKAHQNILAHLSVSKPSLGQEIKGLLGAVDLGAKQVARIRVAQEGRVATSSEAGLKAAAEGKLKAAENKIEEVAKFLLSKAANFEVGAYAKAEARLNEAKLKISEGENLMVETKYGEAFGRFQEAMRIAQEARLVTLSAVKLDFKLNNMNIEIESEQSASSSADLDDDMEVEGELDLDSNINIGL